MAMAEAFVHVNEANRYSAEARGSGLAEAGEHRRICLSTKFVIGGRENM